MLLWKSNKDYAVKLDRKKKRKRQIHVKKIGLKRTENKISKNKRSRLVEHLSYCHQFRFSFLRVHEFYKIATHIN